MLFHINPEIEHNLFQCDPDCAFYTTIPMEHKTQLMLLVVIHRAHVPSIIYSLSRNCTTSCKDIVKILQSSKKALLPYLLNQLKRVLNHHNQSNLNFFITLEQRRKNSACRNHTSVSKNLTKVEKTLEKEEHKKSVAALPL